jgi:hypothetical protein
MFSLPFQVHLHRRGGGAPVCAPTPKSVRDSRDYVNIEWVRSCIPDPMLSMGIYSDQLGLTVTLASSVVPGGTNMSNPQGNEKLMALYKRE